MDVYRKLCWLPTVKWVSRVNYIYLLGCYQKLLRRNEKKRQICQDGRARGVNRGLASFRYLRKVRKLSSAHV